jgi:hypothetical protein
LFTCLRLQTRDYTAMDTLDKYRQIIQKILTEYSQLPYAYSELERQLIIDQTTNHCLLLTLLLAK